MQQGGQVYNVVSNSQQMTKKKKDFYQLSEMTAIMLEKSIAPSLFWNKEQVLWYTNVYCIQLVQTLFC